MTKRKAVVLARVEAGVSPTVEPQQPITATEGSRPAAAPRTIVVGNADTRRVPGVGNTPLQGKAGPTVTVTLPLESTVDPAAGARGSSVIDVTTCADVATYPATEPTNTQDTTLSPTGVPTEGEIRRREALEAFWTLLRDAGYESW